MSNLKKVAKLEEEDDDLELLRLAALKSLNVKKDIISPPSSSHRVVNIGKAIQVIEHAGPVSLVRNTNSVNSFNPTRRNEKLEKSEPYVPQKIVSNDQWVDENAPDYVPYVPSRVAGVLASPIARNIGTNVQLSPRSLAFVSQNTSILLRRKGEVSPGNYNRSPLPAYRTSPGRWSNSPPPNLNSPIWYGEQRRSISFSPPNKRRRSPSFRRSPIKRRSASRSPVPIKTFNSRSPLTKRKSSRSPVRSLMRHNIVSTKMTTVKSPRPLREHQKSPTLIKNRRNSPNRHTQNQGRGRRSMSPMYNRNPSLDAKSSVKWHHTHMHSHSQPYPNSPNIYQKGKKRSRSPLVPENTSLNRGVSPNKSRSVSPIQRKQLRRSKEVSYNGNQVNNRRRNSPNPSYSRKLNKNNRRGSNKYRSPVRRRSRTKSPNNRRLNLRKNDTVREKDKVDSKLSTKSESKLDDEVMNKNSEIKENDNGKISNLDDIDKISENESSLSDDEENEDDKNTNNDNDEIDLFASEESESENEGRFKSSTKKCERNNKSSTLSFSKLGNSSTVSLVGSLKDISGGNNTNSDKGRSNERHSRNNRDYRRDTYKKLDNRSNSSRKMDDYKDNKSKETANDKDKSNKRDDNTMRMFKSTFQAVVDTDTKDRKYSPKYKEETSKDSKELSKENLDKRNTQNKKNEDDKEIVNEATSSNVGIVPTALNTIGKKSIHLRLGPSSKSTQSGVTASSGQSTTSTGSNNALDNNSGKGTLASAAVPINSCTGNSSVTTSSSSSWKTKKTPWRKSEKEVVLFILLSSLLEISTFKIYW